MTRRRSPKSGMPMDVYRLENGVEIDVCPFTGGVWLDLGELSAFTGLETDLPYFEAAVGGARDTIWPSPVASCCLREIRFHPQHDVVVDYCPVTGGVWLDAGELDKIRALVAALPPPYSEAVTALRSLPPEVQAAIAAGAAEAARKTNRPAADEPDTPAVGPDGRRLPPRPRPKR